MEKKTDDIQVKKDGSFILMMHWPDDAKKEKASALISLLILILYVYFYMKKHLGRDRGDKKKSLKS